MVTSGHIIFFIIERLLACCCCCGLGCGSCLLHLPRTVLISLQTTTTTLLLHSFVCCPSRSRTHIHTKQASQLQAEHQCRVYERSRPSRWRRRCAPSSRRRAFARPPKSAPCDLRHSLPSWDCRTRRPSRYSRSYEATSWPRVRHLLLLLQQSMAAMAMAPRARRRARMEECLQVDRHSSSFVAITNGSPSLRSASRSTRCWEAVYRSARSPSSVRHDGADSMPNATQQRTDDAAMPCMCVRRWSSWYRQDTARVLPRSLALDCVQGRGLRLTRTISVGRMQLAVNVQLPRELDGAGGHCIYIGRCFCLDHITTPTTTTATMHD